MNPDHTYDSGSQRQKYENNLDIRLWTTTKSTAISTKRLNLLNHRYSITRCETYSTSRDGEISARLPIRQPRSVDNYGTWQIIKLRQQFRISKKKATQFLAPPFVNSQGGPAALASTRSAKAWACCSHEQQMSSGHGA